MIFYYKSFIIFIKNGIWVTVSGEIHFNHKIEKYILTKEKEKMPSTEELYQLIIQLQQRVTILENENNNLKKQSRKSKNDCFFMEEVPNITFNEWFLTILQNVPDHLQLVFEKDLITGIQTLLNKCILETEQIPICCFDRRPNLFYIYNEENGQNKWITIENKQMNKYILKISREFVVSFNNDWYMVNKVRIQETEHYMDLYLAYYQKVLGGDTMNDQECCSRITKYLYQKVKKKI